MEKLTDKVAGMGAVVSQDATTLEFGLLMLTLSL